MLYLHCGWMRSGTTTLQTALFENRDRLAAASMIFPERWLAKAMPSHSGLAKVLEAEGEPGDPLDRFGVFLHAHRDRDVLLSAEFITTSLFSTEGTDGLLRLLATAREVGPVRCIWTLRRIDRAIRSLFLRRLALGYEMPSPDEHSARIRDLSGLFAGMRRAEEAVEGEASYVKYDDGGTHAGALLDAFDLPIELREPILAQMKANRLNSSIGHKQAVALLEAEALSVRAGVELDREAMCHAFHHGEFRFADDWRCEPVDGAVRRALHERALTAAREQGFAAYIEFFGDEEIEPAAVDLRPEVLTDEDVGRLAARFSQESLAPSSSA